MKIENLSSDNPSANPLASMGAKRVAAVEPISRANRLRRPLPFSLPLEQRQLGSCALRWPGRIGHAFRPDVETTPLRWGFARDLPGTPDAFAFVEAAIIHSMPTHVLFDPFAASAGQVISSMQAKIADAIATFPCKPTLAKRQDQLHFVSARWQCRLQKETHPLPAWKARVGLQFLALRRVCIHARCSQSATL
jgi:hypothetical protein